MPSTIWTERRTPPHHSPANIATISTISRHSHIHHPHTPCPYPKTLPSADAPRSARAWTPPGAPPRSSRASPTGSARPPRPPSPEYVIVEDLPDPLKETYLSILVWLVHSDDSQIDERELCEIQVLMTQLRCSSEVRQAIRSRLEDPGTLDAETRIARLHELVPSETPDTASALKFSLIKDAIRVSRATSNGAAGEQPGIRRLAGLLDIDDKQVAFIEKACEHEEQPRNWRGTRRPSASRSPPST